MNLSISLQQGGQFPRVESFGQAVVAAFDDLGDEAAFSDSRKTFGFAEFWNSSTSFMRCGKGFRR